MRENTIDKKEEEAKEEDDEVTAKEEISKVTAKQGEAVERDLLPVSYTHLTLPTILLV